jgi:hypothetical protein
MVLPAYDAKTAVMNIYWPTHAKGAIFAHLATRLPRLILN